MMFAEFIKTANGEIPENLLIFKSAEGARGTPRISQAKGRNGLKNLLFI